MGIDEFLDFMPQKVTIEPFATRDRYGKASYGTGVVFTARVAGRVRKGTSFTGEEKGSNNTGWVGVAVGISQLDRITLPAGHVPQQPPILAAGRFPDENGDHHTVLFV